ncbi:MAG: mannose-1-phosphate guanylyltransferase/mannose-6-phosphate isomerase [Janthinobacterium lividum]
MKLIPVILCGGSGSRLWPVSRELHPKPFIRLEDGQSLVQKAFLRGATLPGVEEILTVTNRELSFKTKDDFSEVNLDKLGTSYILEPFARNTAPAVATAVLDVIRLHGEQTLMLILPADHLIADQSAFAAAVAKASALAEQGKIVTFGIQPDTPETGYGYIETNGSSVVRFIEKPTLEKAQSYLAAGNFLWNSGMFCFAAGTMRAEMALHCPDVLAAAETCFEHSRFAKGEGFTEVELNGAAFSQVPDISIDYAVMEKSANMAVVPCTIGWNDIGSWTALGDLVDADQNGNRIEGEALLHDTTNCYIRGSERLVAAVGVDNLLIIDTPDALLVVDRSRAQDVKHIYNKLKKAGNEIHKLHRTVHRPWGTYTVLGDGDRFKLKRIEVKPGGSLSLQMHHHRSEHWIVVSGMAKVVNGDNELFVRTNESTYIPAGHQHRLVNPGVLNLVMIEVQSGDYLGEDDIVRFEDIYGRVPA